MFSITLSLVLIWNLMPSSIGQSMDWGSDDDWQGDSCERILATRRDQFLTEIGTLNVFWAHWGHSDLQQDLLGFQVESPTLSPRFEWINEGRRPLEDIDPNGSKLAAYVRRDMSCYFSPGRLYERGKRDPALRDPNTPRFLAAHEMGHHLQNILGLFDAENIIHPFQGQEKFFRLELQADCLAGVYLRGYELQSISQRELRTGQTLLTPPTKFLNLPYLAGPYAEVSPVSIAQRAELIRSKRTRPTLVERRFWFRRGLSGNPEDCRLLEGSLEELLRMSAHAP